MRVSSGNKGWEASSPLKNSSGTSVWLCSVTTGGNPKHSEAEETLSKAGVGHGFFTNEVPKGFFAFLFASWKEQRSCLGGGEGLVGRGIC